MKPLLALNWIYNKFTPFFSRQFIITRKSDWLIWVQCWIWSGNGKRSAPLILLECCGIVSVYFVNCVIDCVSLRVSSTCFALFYWQFYHHYLLRYNHMQLYKLCWQFFFCVVRSYLWSFVVPCVAADMARKSHIPVSYERLLYSTYSSW